MSQKYETIAFPKEIPVKVLDIIYRPDLYPSMNTGRIAEHWHSAIEIIWNKTKGVSFYVDGKCYENVENQILVVNSESIHKIEAHHSKCEIGKSVTTVVQIPRDFVAQLIPDFQEKYFRVFSTGRKEELMGLLSKIATLYPRLKEEDTYGVLEMKGLLYELVALLARTRLVEKSDIMPINNEKNLERLRGILRYIEESYQEPLREEEVAKKFYFSKGYFSRFFHESTGVTFRDYVLDYRVGMAMHDLLFEEKKIMDIALDHGFTDARGYIKAFTARYGMTPLQFRKLYQVKKV